MVDKILYPWQPVCVTSYWRGSYRWRILGQHLLPAGSQVCVSVCVWLGGGDLAIVFGGSSSTMGFPPWQLRLTEILWVCLPV